MSRYVSYIRTRPSSTYDWLQASIPDRPSALVLSFG